MIVVDTSAIVFGEPEREVSPETTGDCSPS
jgi:hypothetical protein